MEKIHKMSPVLRFSPQQMHLILKSLRMNSLKTKMHNYRYIGSQLKSFKLHFRPYLMDTSSQFIVISFHVSSQYIENMKFSFIVNLDYMTSTYVDKCHLWDNAKYKGHNTKWIKFCQCIYKYYYLILLMTLQFANVHDLLTNQF